jgi:hypothetical protein
VVPRGAGRKLAGIDRRVSSDSLQLRVLTLCEADLPYIHSNGLTLYFPSKAEHDLSDFNVLYQKILLRSPILDFNTTNLVYLEKLCHEGFLFLPCNN